MQEIPATAQDEWICQSYPRPFPEFEMTTVDLWKGKFGDEYTQRNAGAEIGARVEMWKSLLPKGCHSILEVGANVGANLDAISRITGDVQFMGCEPNANARWELQHITPFVTADTADSLSFETASVDLVFTSGVLIHIPPDMLEKSMREIHRVSKRWIICGEYFAPSEEMVPYRGQHAAMWRRDYGSMYLDLFSDLKCVKNLFAWKRVTGLDNTTFWVFERT